MIPSELLPILTQVPLVAIFVWFELTNNKAWRTYLEQRDNKWVDVVNKLVDTIDKLDEKIERVDVNLGEIKGKISMRI